jgi:hypothetical protein
MEVGLIVGLSAGLLGAGVGLFFALYALGFFQYLGGKKADPRAVDKKTLQHALMALNDPSKPYHLVPGEDTDLIAEWKIVDASWYGIFSKSRLSKAYRALLFLDEARHSVRYFEIIGTVNWTVGVTGLTPTVHYGRSFFSGRILFQKSYGVGYGIKAPKTLEAGKVYEYRFDVDEIRAPIIDTVRAKGWEWVPVTARRHAVYKSRPHSSSSGAAGSCTRCGAARRPGAKFCPMCGQSVSPASAVIAETQTQRRWLSWTLVVTGLVMMLFTLLVVTRWDNRGIQSGSGPTETEFPKPAFSGRSEAGWQPDTKVHVPTPTVPEIDVKASDRFNEEGLRKVQAGKIMEGAELFAKAVQANPGNAKACNNLGLAMRTTGKVEAAIKAYRQAIKAQPAFALTYKNLGVALEQAGMNAEAVQAYLKYAELAPAAADVFAVQERARELSTPK